MTRARRRERAGAAGFTILEVVLALGILLLGITAILGLLSFGGALARTAELRASAAEAVEAVIADLEGSLFPLEPDGSVGEPVEIVDRAIPGRPGLVYSAAAEPNPDAPRVGATGTVPVEYRVDVEIRWDSGGRRRAKTFTTLLARGIPFGERMRREFVLGRDGGEGTRP